MAKTTEDFKREVFEATGDEYNVIGEYVRAKVSTKMYHSKCDDYFEMRPDNFKTGQRCPHCSGRKRKCTEAFKKEVFDLEGDDYIVIGEYVNNKTEIEILHVECNEPYKTTPKQFLRGDRCTHCRYKKLSIIKSLTIEEYKQRVFNQVGDEYVVTGNWNGANEDITMFHKTCNREIEMTPNNFYHHKKRCLFCSSSKGELLISGWLTENKFDFSREYKFDNCRNKRPLPFDFAVFDKDGEINTLIEFNGIQHYETVAGWGGNGKLERSQLTDGIKRRYCEDNDINLLVIPYWNIDNVERILKQYLMKEVSLSV